MKILQAVAATAFLCLAFAGFASAEEARSSWTIARSDKPGAVELELRRQWTGGQSNHTAAIAVSELQGLVFEGAKREVKFALVREAGRFDCEGYLENGEGAGLFRFTPADGFAPAMRELGFGGVTEDLQFAMAVLDVTTAFAREMQALNLDDLDTDKLMAMKIFTVSAPFVTALRAEGLPARDSNKVIAFRIHGVTVETVRALRKAGLAPTEDQLIAMHVHGVTPEYVRNVQALGFDGVQPDQLVAMRVHDVTADYISTLKSRGLKDLSIDQLINLKIHGID